MVDISMGPAAADEANRGTGRRASRSVALWRVGLAAGLAVVVWMVVLAARGMFVRFSPVPWFDSWSGLVGFDRRLPETGLLAGLWEPHNGHRIVLTRLLYLGDKYLGGGDLEWLIVANGVLAMMLAAALAWLCWRMLPSWHLRALFGVLSLVACASWVHHENLTWEFQSQLILAPLLAVLAFVAAGVGADARGSQRSRQWLAAAVALAVLAMGAMGAGALVPILLLLMLACARVSRRTILIAAAVLLPLMAFYFMDLSAFSGEGVEFSLAKAVFGVLVFLGAPIGIVTKSLTAAAVVGAAVLVPSAVLAIRALRGRLPPAQIAGVAVVGYAVANAAVAARVRLGAPYLGGPPLGIDVMQASRYEFIVLSGWVALLALLVSTAPSPRVRSVIAAAGAAFVLILLVPFQLAALEVPVGKEAGQPRGSAPTAFTSAWQRAMSSIPGRMTAGLGVALGVRDFERQLPTLYYRESGWTELADYARDSGIGAFDGIFSGLVERIGTPETGGRQLPCTGSVLSAAVVPDDPAWLRVEGWTRPANGDPAAELIAIMGADGRVAGFAATDYPAPTDVAWPSSEPKPVGFSGYVRAFDWAGADASMQVSCLVQD